MSNEGYESDKNKAVGDFEKPKDGTFTPIPQFAFLEFVFYGLVFKQEEKKLLGHIRFEQLVAQYW